MVYLFVSITFIGIYMFELGGGDAKTLFDSSGTTTISNQNFLEDASIGKGELGKMNMAEIASAGLGILTSLEDIQGQDFNQAFDRSGLTSGTFTGIGEDTHINQGRGGVLGK